MSQADNMPNLHLGWGIIEHEVSMAATAFAIAGKDSDDAATCKAEAQKAFEDGKRKLLGWERSLPQ